MTQAKYTEFVRNRITQLRMAKGVSEHKMSLELGKSGSYIRRITNGSSLPSLKELFNIIDYFEITPSIFFAPLEVDKTFYSSLCDRLREMGESELKKVDTFMNWITEHPE